MSGPPPVRPLDAGSRALAGIVLAEQGPDVRRTLGGGMVPVCSRDAGSRPLCPTAPCPRLPLPAATVLRLAPRHQDLGLLLSSRSVPRQGPADVLARPRPTSIAGTRDRRPCARPSDGLGPPRQDDANGAELRQIPQRGSFILVAAQCATCGPFDADATPSRTMREGRMHDGMPLAAGRSAADARIVTVPSCP